MVPNKINLSIVTPIFPPAAGGAAQYTRILTRWLSKNDGIGRIEVFTEKHPDRKLGDVFADGVELKECFAYRAGKQEKDINSHFLYLFQQIQLFFLILFKFKSTNVVLVHSSFLIRFGLIGYAVKIRRYFNKKIKFIADVRDLQLNTKSYSRLEGFNHVLCCSEMLRKRLENHQNLSKRISMIPIILEPLEVDEALSIELLKKFGIENKKIVFSGNGILIDRGIITSLKVVEELRKIDSSVTLVVAGRKRDWNEHVQTAADSGLLKFVGSLRNNELLALLSRASLHINFSYVEGMPRGTLEAAALGIPYIPPMGVSEFGFWDKFSTAETYDIDELVRLSSKILIHNEKMSGYDMSKHFSKCVIPKYVELFKSLCS